MRENAETDGSSAVKPGGRYTLEEWRQWPEDERWELIRGVAWAMSPAPHLNHQRLLLRLATQLATQLRGAPCEPLISPVDLYLDEDTVVQPDLMIVCDPSKLTLGSRLRSPYSRTSPSPPAVPDAPAGG